MGIIKRPVLRWHGGKWLLAPWVISHFPKHRIYTEAYGGAGSVLLRKPRAYAEIYNDLDDEVVNCFRVLQNEKEALRLRKMIEATPFARREFERSYEKTEDRVEKARRLIARCFMGFGSNAQNERVRTGFRASSNRLGTTPAQDWAGYPAQIKNFIERFRGVVIEHREARDVILQHDSSKTLHYVDPPYVASTRTDDSPDYHHEMTDEDHRVLASTLKGLEGMVVLSGYASRLYDRELYRGWARIEKKTFSDGARARVEVLYFNEAAKRAQWDLFA